MKNSSKLYLNQFSNKKGPIGKPETPKRHPIWAARFISRTHLSTKYPPTGFLASTKAQPGIVHLDVLSPQTNTTSAPARESILIHNVGTKYLITPYHKKPQSQRARYQLTSCIIIAQVMTGEGYTGQVPAYTHLVIL